ncbi:DUF1002 domain-containing protein [Sediminibacillus albus]|uniref:Uncharacterized protein YpuA, DUF1002 family n=1 Tax=Sediminibacillus albus TaxID=407036 RepID=A0A1G8ZVS6_9BACI|nr:DUF1002 domain-containing protein [Sediminibacillus albus]SDK19081.1 Uncharacterized protein YpuA, DUF1002 family [Sediminibacillus albus]
MSKWFKLSFILMLVIGFVSMTGSSVFASEGNGKDSSEVINEKLGVPRVVYGETLTEAQKEEVRSLLDVDDPEMVDEYTVTAEDLVNYIDGDPNSRMFSSAKITRKEEGSGLVINVVNSENITEVTNEMYANALLTAGVENAVVDVASPKKVTGHSALTGIYKAFNVEGESLDKDRMEVANEELNVATDLADNEGMDQEKVSELLTQIKQQIAEQNPATKEEVEQIVQEQLDKLNIELSEEDKAMLTNLFEKMRNINIDFDNVRGQLDDIASDIRSKLDEVAGNEGFWQGVADFFQRLINGIKGLFN